MCKPLVGADIEIAPMARSLAYGFTKAGKVLRRWLEGRATRLVQVRAGPQG